MKLLKSNNSKNNKIKHIKDNNKTKWLREVEEHLTRAGITNWKAKTKDRKITENT